MLEKDLFIFVPVPIRPGVVLACRLEHQTILLLDGANSHDWPNGDDKLIATFIKDEETFAEFCEVLGNMHGLSTRRFEVIGDLVAFEFFKTK